MTPTNTNSEPFEHGQELTDILSSYYNQQLAKLPSQVAQSTAHRLMATGLIVGDRCVPLSETSITSNFEVNKELLQQLCDVHLLSSIQTSMGTSYQLATPLLVKPILAAKEPSPSNPDNSFSFNPALTTISVLALALVIGASAWIYTLDQETIQAQLKLAESEQETEAISYLAQTTAQTIQVQQEISYRLKISTDNRQNTITKLINQYQLKIDRSPFKAWYALGVLYGLKGDSYEKQIGCYNQFLKMEENAASAYYDRGQAYYHLERYDKAIADFEKALEINPDYEAAQMARASVYQARGQYKEALAEYSKTLTINADNEYIWKNRADIYTVLKDYNRALKDYNKALQINPYDETIWNARANTYAVLKQYEDALEDYGKALQVNPNATYIQENQKKVLAFSLAKNQRPSDTNAGLQLANIKQGSQHKPSGNEAVLVNIKDTPTPNPNELGSGYQEQLPSDEVLKNSDANFLDKPKTAPDSEWVAIEKAKKQEILTMHASMHDLWWLLGKWETEAINATTSFEEWTIKDSRIIEGRGFNSQFQEDFLIQYQKGQVILTVQLDATKTVQYRLVTADDYELVFKQTKLEKYPDQITFDRRPNGGYTTTIHNSRGDIPKKQQRYLKNRNLLLDNQAVRKTRPTHKGSL